MKLDPKRFGNSFYVSAWHASTFYSLSLLIPTATFLMWVTMSNTWTLRNEGFILGRCRVIM